MLCCKLLAAMGSLGGEVVMDNLGVTEPQVRVRRERKMRLMERTVETVAMLGVAATVLMAGKGGGSESTSTRTRLTFYWLQAGM
jgi:hypothetical protein